MEKSPASSQIQKPSTGRRTRSIPSTPVPEIMTPPTPQSMVSPISDTSQPTETSGGSLYRKILEDVMGKLGPTGKMSEVFAHLATKFKEEEEQPQIPTGIPTDTTAQAETFAKQPLTGQVTPQTTSPAEDPTEILDHDEEERNSRGKKGNSEGGDENVQEQVVERSKGKVSEVVNVDEEGSSDDRETLDERTKRRSLRTAKKEEMVEVKGKLIESAAKAVEEFQMEARKRKGKQAATSSTKRKPDQAIKGVVIRKPIEDLTIPSHRQIEEQGSEAMETSDDEGVYEKLEVKLDQKLLEAMVYFKDPKMRRDCAGRGQKGKNGF